MILATERKLREARFFLDRLIAESKRAVRNEPEALGFYLSAFLSAARSVTFALQHEEKDRYDAWFPSWFAQRGVEDQELLNFLKTQRNYAEKRGGADVEFDWEYILVTLLPIENRAHPAYGFTWSGVPGAPPPAVGIPVHSFQSPRGDSEVVPTCQRYVGILAELVQDFVQAHSLTEGGLTGAAPDSAAGSLE